MLTSKDANLIKAHLLGPASDPVAVEFALEAKCYAADMASAFARRADSSPG